MRFALSVFAVFLGLGQSRKLMAASKRMAMEPEITVNSVVGQHLLKHARRVANMNNKYNEFDWTGTSAWIAGYSVKFQGCQSIKQWNNEADSDSDVRIATKRLVRFRLCPHEVCSSQKASGCSSGYGDYIIDLTLFLEAYYYGKLTQIEYDCETFYTNKCSCNNDDGKDDNFNADYCTFDCYNKSGMTQCIDKNPYDNNANDNQNNFNLEKYMECAELRNGRMRQLADQVQYFVGPYCTSQGGAIRLGLFTDDACTTNASSVSFQDLFGFSLPYSGPDDNLVDMDCLKCLEMQSSNKQKNNNGGDDDLVDADEVNELCEELYSFSGKCEANLPSGMNSNPNNNACTYMEGIRIVRQDGIIDTGSSRPSAVSTSFIVIFSMAFAAMAFYVWYLRTRLGVKKNSLL